MWDTPIIVALITLGGIIANLFLNWWNNYNNIKLQKETQEANERLQKELAKRNIDADLIAKARITWIQEVRGEMSKLLTLAEKRNTSIHSWLTSTSFQNRLRYENEIKKIDNEVVESANKLKLMFGPDENKIEVSSFILRLRNDPGVLTLFNYGTNSFVEGTDQGLKEILDKLLSIKTNKGKNEIIVAIIQLVIANSSINFDDFDQLVDGRKADDSLYKSNILIYSLGDIMRLYLKVEWEKAKRGE